MQDRHQIENQQQHPGAGYAISTRTLINGLVETGTSYRKIEIPRAPSTFPEGVWGGCQEGPVIPYLRRYDWSPGEWLFILDSGRLSHPIPGGRPKRRTILP